MSVKEASAGVSKLDKSNGHTAEPARTRKVGDYGSDQDVRWCPGCGDYAILNLVKKTMAKLQTDPDQVAFISGIGCSSRFPYYMSTYGIHSIHGRAPGIATGLKVARPDIEVWVATGDGDGLSIGGNHLLHVLRRNVDLKILLFNNRIYGLTKGQYSPTSERGKVTGSTPYGSLDAPVSPISFALGAGATFVARTIDRNPKHMEQVFMRAAQHKGTAFVEVYQNCNIYNDLAFQYSFDRQSKDDHILVLEHGKPMIFGKERDKGIRIGKNFQPEIVTLGQDGVGEDDLLVHDEATQEPMLAFLLSRLQHPDFPEPIGIFRAVDAPTYDEAIVEQIAAVTRMKGKPDLQELLNGAEMWRVA